MVVEFSSVYSKVSGCPKISELYNVTYTFIFRWEIIVFHTDDDLPTVAIGQPRILASILQTNNHI